ncbi:MAG: type III-B CRISPR module RAMP protein Cmr4 [Thermodesulfovibrionales bacterium]
MFTEKKVLFIYSVSPVHMGAGTTLGVVDNPIQRERHTEHPLMAGSGIKGAMRHEARGNGLKDDIPAIFGPESHSSSQNAGAVSFSDGQIVLFPVRSLREGFVYATCPTALARLARLLDVAEIAHGIDAPKVAPEKCVALTDEVLDDGKLVLEAYEYEHDPSGRDVLKRTAEWLAENAFVKSTANEFFRDKVKKHTVLLNDGEFAFFVKNATVVEPHVRIDDTTGTAEGGGLFFTENLPPESLMVSLMMASDERRNNGDARKAAELAGMVASAFNGKLLQIGGDATTGRGQVVLRFIGDGGAQ